MSAASINGWKPIASAPDGEEIATSIIDGRVIRDRKTLVRKGRLWFYPDGLTWSCKPTHWRAL